MYRRQSTTGRHQACCKQRHSIVILTPERDIAKLSTVCCVGLKRDYEARPIRLWRAKPSANVWRYEAVECEASSRKQLPCAAIAAH